MQTQAPEDRVRVHKHSRGVGHFEGTFWRRFDKGDAGRYLLAAERFEMARRKAGQRCGFTTVEKGQTVGAGYAVDVLRALLRLVDFRTGRLDPSIDYLQRKLGRSRAAIVRALKALREAGFLDWIRRYESTGLAQPAVKQISNAYRLALPPAAARLLGAFAAAPGVPDDLAVHAAQQARTTAEHAFSETPLGTAMERLGRLVQSREFTQQTESPMSGLIGGVPAGAGTN